MDISAWIAISIGIVIPFIGWIFNTLITNKINELDKNINALEVSHETNRAVLFKRLDETKDYFSDHLEKELKEYTRFDIYAQAIKHHSESNDEKFKNLMQTMNKQFENMDDKIDELKKIMTDKIKGVA